MIYILIESSKRTGLRANVGVATERADVTKFFERVEAENINGAVECWSPGKSEPDAEFSGLAEWSGEPAT